MLDLFEILLAPLLRGPCVIVGLEIQDAKVAKSSVESYRIGGKQDYTKASPFCV
jgi:hypothetical protein